MLTEFTFGVVAKLIQLAQWTALIWLIKKVFFNYFFLLYIKMSEKNYYQINRDVILNRAKDYYESDKEILGEHARDK